MKAAFLDRDGTIIKDYPDNEWHDKINPEFLPGALTALSNMQSQGYSLFLISNQYLLEEGLITEAAFSAFCEKFDQVLDEAGIKFELKLYSPYARSKNHHTMKPNRGMIDEILASFPSIDLDESFLAGDSDADELLAARIPVRFFRITDNMTLKKVSESLAANKKD